MSSTDILIFDVGLGQSIFVYPHSHPEYGMLVDCGHTDEFHPIDFLLERNFIPNRTIGNLTLTNYDHDHYSGLPYLWQNVTIASVSFAPTFTSSELRAIKDTPTSALDHVCHVRDTYIYPAINHQPPYTKQAFCLERSQLQNPDTNNLSQVVFVEHFGTVICISGDLEVTGWNLLLKNPLVRHWLTRTSVFVASHHGRENGYCPEVFLHCNAPECIVISDKGILHDTQQDMSSLYGTHVSAPGICVNGDTARVRKVLTTRDDNHIWIQLSGSGNRTYRTFNYE